MQLVVASASASTSTTQPTEIIATATVTAPTKLDTLPDEILLDIAEFTGANFCYLGYGAVNKRINQLFNTYNNKLSKSTSYGGYTPYQKIVKSCEMKLKNERECYSRETPTVYHQVASGVVTFNRKDLLNWAVEKQNIFIHQAICERAIKDRKQLIFEKVWESIENKNMIIKMKRQTSFISIAAEKGFLDWLIYLCEKLECYWNYRACSSAARGGHLDCLMYLHKEGCPWDKNACEYAAGGGHLYCLMYLHEEGCPWDSSACSSAAGGGHLECLMYLHEQGCEWHEYTCNYAAHSGHLDCLIYLHIQGCEWNENTCDQAACGGHLDCLVYLHKYGCEWHGGTCSRAARGGHIDCLRYLHKQGCEWNIHACSGAAREGHLDCLKYLHNHGCEWDSGACSSAASGGHLDCLIYLHEHGCEWNERACHEAARRGHLDCLRYLHKKGCDWDEWACSEAASGGHLQCLKYFHEQGCPWNNEACFLSAMNGHLNCLQYMRDNGLEWCEYDKFLLEDYKLHLKSTGDDHAYEIDQQKYLGALVSPLMPSKPQIKKLRLKIKAWCKKIMHSRLSPKQIIKAYEEYLVPALAYPLGVCDLSYEECDSLMAPIRKTIGKKKSYHTSSKKGVTHGPKELLGEDLPHLFDIARSEKLSFLPHAKDAK